MNQNSFCNNPHSTTSPKLSPTNISLTNSSHLTPPPTDENDNNINNVDEGFENDNISVTGSPLQANSTEDDERRSPSPLPNTSSSGTSNGGAFTSLIQRNTNNLKKSDFLTGFSSQFNHQQQPNLHPIHHQPQQPTFNPALAAQLFLQSPLMPQPSQWLYSQLYGNYDLQWFRSTLQSNNANSLRLTSGSGNLQELNSRTENDHLTLGKRTVTLISHQDNEREGSTSPPVSSSKRTPSPEEEITVVAKEIEDGDGVGPIKCRTPKQNDVWRPY